jgi:beta-mannosidase
VKKPDTIGKSFYFKLNGKAVFIKGANWVPDDNFLPLLTAQDYKKLIEQAVWANFNMLRVWGGGIYESDDFYNRCDKNGILVWQDFMFACNMYLGDTAFVNNVKHEAIDNIIRLRNHPSIALWCGNNEIDNAWKDWGWQKQLGYTKQDSTEIWNNYLKIFENLLPDLVNKYDGTRDYHPSSPTYGWGHKENFTQGDSHYWGVWWGHEPYEVFNSKIGRFMSEYGFQALPNIKSIKQFTPENQLYIGSESLKTHQKHPTGYQTIDEYLQQYYKPTTNLEDYIYLSQLTQAEGITTAIEAHRRAMPVCMGTLYWQFNDAWPVTSWSSIDYYGRKKALHYFVKQAYKPTIISSIEKNDSINIYVISDKQTKQNLELKIYYQDFYGKIIFKDSIKITAKNNSFIAYQIPKKKLQNKKQNSFIYTELYQDSELLDNDFYYFTKPKNLQLPEAEINIEVRNKISYFIVELQSNILVKNIELIANLDGEFSNNFFDLLPNTKKEVRFYKKEKGELKIEYKCLN